MKKLLVFIGLAQALLVSVPSYAMDIEQCSGDLRDFSGASESIRREACQKASIGAYGIDCLYWGLSSTGEQPLKVASVCAMVNTSSKLNCMETHIQSMGGSIVDAAHACPHNG